MAYKTNNLEGDTIIGRHLHIGGEVAQQGSSHIKGNLKVDGWLFAYNVQGANKGLFQTEAKLKEAFPSPQDGWWAIVGNTLPGPIYAASGGVWAATDQEGGEPIVDIPYFEENIEELRGDVMALQEDVGDIKNKFLGLGYTYAGIATLSTTPIDITAEDKVFYIAVEAGDYTGFGQLGITELTILKSEEGRWEKEGLGIALDIDDKLTELEQEFTELEQEIELERQKPIFRLLNLSFTADSNLIVQKNGYQILCVKIGEGDIISVVAKEQYNEPKIFGTAFCATKPNVDAVTTDVEVETIIELNKQYISPYDGYFCITKHSYNFPYLSISIIEGTRIDNNEMNIADINARTKSLESEIFNQSTITIQPDVFEANLVDGKTGLVVQSQNPSSYAGTIYLNGDEKSLDYLAWRFDGDYGYGIFDVHDRLLEAKSIKDIIPDVTYGRITIDIPAGASYVNLSFSDNASSVKEVNIHKVDYSNPLTMESTVASLVEINGVDFSTGDTAIQSGTSSIYYVKIKTKSVLTITASSMGVTRKFGYAISYEEPSIGTTIYNAVKEDRLAIDDTKNIDEECFFIITHSQYNFKDTTVVITSNVTDRLGAEIKELQEGKDSIPQLESILGSGGETIKADILASGDRLQLANYPQCNKVGDCYAFNAKITAFDKLKVCHGYMSYISNWFEITTTHVNLYRSNDGSDVELMESVEHGLDITAYISVNIQIDDDCNAKLCLMTLAGDYRHTFEKWWEASHGVLQVISDGTTLEKAVFAANNRKFSCPLWVFGASQEKLSDSMWVGQIKSMGYFDFLLNALSGRDSMGIANDLRRALRYGCPKYLYFGLSNDGYDFDVYSSRMDAAKAIADEYGIEIIFVVKPMTPIADESYKIKADYVRNYGCRYFDFANAVSADVDDTNAIYDGYLSSDWVHPTPLGARALALRFMVDVPEVMK